MAENLLSANRDLLGERGQVMYDNLASLIFPMLAYQNFTAGVEALTMNNYLVAVEQLSRAVQMDESIGEGYGLLSLGRAYEGIADIENAIVHFRRVIELFPYGEISSLARERVDGLAQDGVQEPEVENEE
jgi:tetratricopeptide (TPR) repeat protein